ncbi:MAG: DUF512 domain-containing protein [Clostridia bacterium]
MLTIKTVENGSIGNELKLKSGDILLSFDEIEVVDELDYLFYNDKTEFTMQVQRKKKIFDFEIEKDEDESLGLDFVEELTTRTCHNKCIFCFVDQMPKGFRETLYCKDDDYRFSFISGNYITLTNDTPKDLQRIMRLKLSPLYVSVHATEKNLRIAMLKNKFAGDIMEQLRQLTAAGIDIHTQVVLCKNINDGEHLQKTMEDLFSLYPKVKSLAIVPVGLTKYRDNLAEIEPSDKEFAEKVIDQVTRFSGKAFIRTGERFVFCSDEFYCLANREVPSGAFYGDYPQIENGVGLIRKFVDEFDNARRFDKVFSDKKTLIITGKSFYPTMKKLVESVSCPHKVQMIENTLFGETVTVAGLLTAKVILNQINLDKIDRILLPQNVLREFKNEFLDDITLEQFKQKTQKEVVICENDGAKFYENL